MRDLFLTHALTLILLQVDYTYIHKKQSGGRGQYAKIVGTLEPIPAEDNDVENTEFVDETIGGTIPPEYISAVEKVQIPSIAVEGTAYFIKEKWPLNQSSAGVRGCLGEGVIGWAQGYGSAHASKR